MALLRQCLQEVRMRHHEWEVPDTDWPEAAWPQPAAEGWSASTCREGHALRGVAHHAGLLADQRHLS